MSGGLKVAFIGTRGVPAAYGGFETAVEEIGTRLKDYGYESLVYCRTASGAGPGYPSDYRGMELVWLPSIRIRSVETLSHTFLSLIHAMIRSKPDISIVFNCASAPLLLLAKLRMPLILHVDGIESRRTKWGKVGRRYYRFCEWMASKLNIPLIADASGIRQYYQDEFETDTHVIAYGARLIDESQLVDLSPLGLEGARYALVVSRLEPENHVLDIVKAFVASKLDLTLVVVGANPYRTPYVNDLVRRSDHAGPRVKLLGPIWDQSVLDTLYARAYIYIHGHSVGGTNPSLLRAMGAGKPVIAHDNIFNREVLADNGRSFSSEEDLRRILDEFDLDFELMNSGLSNQTRVEDCYKWDTVARAYVDLLKNTLLVR